MGPSPPVLSRPPNFSPGRALGWASSTSRETAPNAIPHPETHHGHHGRHRRPVVHTRRLLQPLRPWRAGAGLRPSLTRKTNALSGRTPNLLDALRALWAALVAIGQLLAWLLTLLS